MSTTTTDNKWKTSAGPVQTKRVLEAARAFTSRARATRVLDGVIGGDEREFLRHEYGAETPAAAREAMDAIGDKFGWEITRKNCRDVVAAFEAAAAALELPTEDNRISPEEHAQRESDRQRAIEEHNAAEAARKARAAEQSEQFTARAPAGSTAVIVAERHEDTSDHMTDYHGHRVTRRVVIGFRKGKRESFKRLREAAAQFPETAHLGPGCDAWAAQLVYDHDSSSPEAEQCYYVPRESYFRGQSVRIPDNRSPEFLTEAELQEWIAGQSQRAGTEWRAHCEEVEHRENYSMGGGNYLMRGYRHGSGWCVRSYPLASMDWSNVEDGLPAPVQGNAADGAEIVEHFHTKRNATVYIVTMGERVDRDEFDRLRSQAKALGGWYSRKWKDSPAGFAFEARDQAEAFIGGEQAKPAETRSGERSANRADRLRELADGMESAIEHKLRPLDQNPTPKRLRELRSRQHTGDDMRRAQRALRALADLHEAGAVPPILEDVRTKKAALHLMRTHYGDPGTCNADLHGVYVDESPQARALQSLISDDSPDPVRRKIETEEHELRLAKIPGFFPTPPELARQVVEAADIQPGARVLEPSAGTGSLAEAVTEAEPSAVVTCVEVVPRLVELMKLKGLSVHCCDFLDCPDAAGLKFDRIVMNPPFERQADIDHVRQAYGHLRRNGRLVAIMSAGVEYRSDRKATEFREWLDDIGGTIASLPEGVFQGADAFRQTGVRAVMVTIDR